MVLRAQGLGLSGARLSVLGFGLRGFGFGSLRFRVAWVVLGATPCQPMTPKHETRKPETDYSQSCRRHVMECISRELHARVPIIFVII